MDNGITEYTLELTRRPLESILSVLSIYHGARQIEGRKWVVHLLRIHLRASNWTNIVHCWCIGMLYSPLVAPTQKES